MAGTFHFLSPPPHESHDFCWPLKNRCYCFLFCIFSGKRRQVQVNKTCQLALASACLPIRVNLRLPPLASACLPSVKHESHSMGGLQKITLVCAPLFMLFCHTNMNTATLYLISYLIAFDHEMFFDNKN